MGSVKPAQPVGLRTVELALARFAVHFVMGLNRLQVFGQIGSAPVEPQRAACRD